MRRFLPIVPALLLGLAAGFSVAVGSDRTTSVGLGLAAIGVLVGVGGTSLALRGFVADFESELEQVAGGRLDTDVGARSPGPLASLAGPLGRVADALKAAQEAATIDRLTRIASRPALLDRAFSEVDRATRYGRPLAIAFIDIDHFKAVNDSYGHDAGDIVLRGVAAVFGDNLRASDFVGRYGG
jgi:GGDEF domain-containing protein